MRWWRYEREPTAEPAIQGAVRRPHVNPKSLHTYHRYRESNGSKEQILLPHRGISSTDPLGKQIGFLELIFLQSVKSLAPGNTSLTWTALALQEGIAHCEE